MQTKEEEIVMKLNLGITIIIKRMSDENFLMNKVIVKINVAFQIK